MQSTQVFGKIPEIVATTRGDTLSPVRAWRFIAPDDSELPSVAGTSPDFVTQVPPEEIDALRKQIEEASDPAETPRRIFVDLPVKALSGTGSWRPSGIFGTRSEALARIGLAPGNIGDGSGVGVIILDAGINRDYIARVAGNDRYGGGWCNLDEGKEALGRFVDPHVRVEAAHGNMIARNILSIAPNATIYDAPILPPAVYNLHGFSSDVVGALIAIEQVIRNDEGNPDWPVHDHWILVNAWAIATSFADQSAEHSYADSRLHPLNEEVLKLAFTDNVDVVFAAGNAGVFAPVHFTGPYDRGFGNSIWGANGLPEVFTIGAVRADGIAVGTSSQGPSRLTLMETFLAGDFNRKPDLCAPSWFCEDEDAGVVNTGTSTSCALFAGMLAALRSAGMADDSDAVKADLIANASNNGHWDAQLGHGVPILQPTAFV